MWGVEDTLVPGSHRVTLHFYFSNACAVLVYVFVLEVNGQYC